MTCEGLLTSLLPRIFPSANRADDRSLKGISCIQDILELSLALGKPFLLPSNFGVGGDTVNLSLMLDEGTRGDWELVCRGQCLDPARFNTSAVLLLHY